METSSQDTDFMDLRNDLAFNETLLISLDSSIEDSESQRRELEARIADLRKKISEAQARPERRAPTPSGLDGRAGSRTPYGYGARLPTSLSQESRWLGEHDSNGEAINSDSEGWRQNSATSSFGQRPKRKRSSGARDAHQVKSSRLMNGSQGAAAGSMTSSGFEDISDDVLDVIRSLQGDAGDPTEFINRMREQEELARERAEQERRDAEYARELQATENTGPAPSEIQRPSTETPRIGVDNETQIPATTRSAPTPGRQGYIRQEPDLGSSGRDTLPFQQANPGSTFDSDMLFVPQSVTESTGSVARLPSSNSTSRPVAPTQQMPGSYIELSDSDGGGDGNRDGNEEENGDGDDGAYHDSSLEDTWPFRAIDSNVSGFGVYPSEPFDAMDDLSWLTGASTTANGGSIGSSSAQLGNTVPNPWSSYAGPSSAGWLGGNASSTSLTDEPSSGISLAGPSNSLSTGQNQLNGFGGAPYTGIPGMPPVLGGLYPRSPYSSTLNGPVAGIAGNQAAAAYYDYVSNDPTKTREEIKSLLENIRPDMELPPENREGTPEGMKYPLMEHQKLGLSWLRNMEEGSNKGGILADDMGLGKTIQALALILSRPSKDPRRKTTLIVAPVALLKQWEREIATKVKASHRLRTYMLYGSHRNAKWSNLREHDVVLTSFGTLSSELKKKEGWDMKKRADPSLTSADAPNMPLLGESSKWYRVIIDEAQCIKNRTTKAAIAAGFLQSVTRFCLTGTPMMNNVTELHSLIEFLRIKPYNEAKKFNQDFSIPLKRGHAHTRDQAMKKLQALLKAILLRRTKKSKIDGKPIIELEPRNNHTEHAVFDDDEQAFYKALESQTQLQFNKYLKAGSVGRHYSNVLVLLLRLRQACCHPHLIHDFVQDGGPPNAEVSVSDMEELARQLAPDVVARIKALEAFECPVCYDAVDNPAIFLPCGHDTCSECFSKISDQSGMQGLAQGVERADVKCPQCRGNISTKKIIDYATFKKVHMEEGGCDSAEAAVDEDDDVESDEEDEETDSETGSMDDFIVPDDEETESEHGTGSNPFEKAAGGTKKTSGDKSRQKRSKRAKEKGKEKVSTKSLAQLKKEGTRNAEARRAYMRRLRRDWVPSAKVDKCCEILERIHTESPEEKTIVFSQFTSLLDLLEIPIARNKWGFARYDGSMSASQRNEAVMGFSDPENRHCRIMLVSLKAGNAGLNLVAASQVIILDPFWNPFIEEQAIDRTHRIGQQRPVHVHRILVQETVEDRIIALQEKKRELIEGALDEKASQNIGRLGTRELAFLFGVSAN